MPEAAARARRLYTAQDVARFCEVDLKTIHHWADRGKIPHHRTTGRHLRFRRNHLVDFMRAHGYPLPNEVTSARPAVFIAVGAGGQPSASDLAKKLGARFDVRSFETGLAAVAHLVAAEPDALVLSLGDPTLGGARTLAALKASPETSWMVLVAVGDATGALGADVVLGPTELVLLPFTLAERLAVA